MARYKESKYRYAVYRKHRQAKGFGLHSKHMTKKNAKKILHSVKKRFGRGYIKKLK